MADMKIRVKREDNTQILAQSRHSGPDLKPNRADGRIPIVLKGFGLVFPKKH